MSKESASLNLVKFIRLLRGLGLKVSARELNDVFQALLLVDLVDGQQVYQALKLTLVKDLHSENIFNQAFVDFFGRGNITAGTETEEVKDLTFQDKPLELTQEEQVLFRQLDPAQRESMQDFLDKTSEGKKVTSRFLPVVMELVKGQMDFYKRQMPRFWPIELTGDAEIDNMLIDVSQKLMQEEEALIHKDMGKLSPEDMAKVKRTIYKLTRRLASRLTRRKKKTNKHGLLDVRNSIRQSIQHGGTIFKVKYRQRRRRKPDLIYYFVIFPALWRDIAPLYCNFVMA
ncbi:VWA domain-containing protein [Bacillota bacterium LX-D]|nr:VWA domain-containing protein [Bacillota bacterium LX-D]